MKPFTPVLHLILKKQTKNEVDKKNENFPHTLDCGFRGWAS